MTTDTAPSEFRDLAEARLYNNDGFNNYADRCADVGAGNSIPADWLEAAAMEAYVAFTEALDTWVETLIAGRPPTQSLVEWEHRDLSPHADCIPVDDVMEAAQR